MAGVQLYQFMDQKSLARDYSKKLQKMLKWTGQNCRDRLTDYKKNEAVSKHIF